MKKKVVFIHTVPGTVLSMKEAFYRQYPDAELVNILDDGILPEVKENNGKVTQSIIDRLISYVKIAQNYGASAALCMCTTVAPVMDIAAEMVKIPLLKIDAPMMKEAVSLGHRIAVLCTAPFTLVPSAQTATREAEKLNKSPLIEAVLVENAFDAANLEGDLEKHDRLVIEAAKKAAPNYDVIVMAQVSMKRAADKLCNLGKPVVSSIPSGIEQLASYLK